MRYNYVLYLFPLFCYHCICSRSRRSRTKVFLKKVFLKISLNSQENTRTEVSLLSAARSFINKEALLPIFDKSSTELSICYCITSRSKTDLEILSFVKVSAKNCFRFILQQQVHDP